VTVDSWQPSPETGNIDSKTLERLLNAASSFASDQNFTPDLNWIQPLAKADAIKWKDAVQDLTDDQLILLIKMLTILETQQNWDLADKSPVITIFKLYKKKSGIDKDLVKWVKANTDNQYLPFGPLL
jgi:uncharacterized protein YihD (DUF1040 family)